MVWLAAFSLAISATSILAGQWPAEGSNAGQMERKASVVQPSPRPPAPSRRKSNKVGAPAPTPETQRNPRPVQKTAVPSADPPAYSQVQTGSSSTAKPSEFFDRAGASQWSSTDHSQLPAWFRVNRKSDVEFDVLCAEPKFEVNNLKPNQSATGDWTAIKGSIRVSAKFSENGTLKLNYRPSVNRAYELTIAVDSTGTSMNVSIVHFAKDGGTSDSVAGQYRKTAPPPPQNQYQPQFGYAAAGPYDSRYPYGYGTSQVSGNPVALQGPPQPGYRRPGETGGAPYNSNDGRRVSQAGSGYASAHAYQPQWPSSQSQQRPSTNTSHPGYGFSSAPLKTKTSSKRHKFSSKSMKKLGKFMGKKGHEGEEEEEGEQEETGSDGDDGGGDDDEGGGGGFSSFMSGLSDVLSGLGDIDI